jgi:broad specificity phosphatase PhoE
LAPVRTLLLVRHAATVIDPAQAAARWSLSETGRVACSALADRLAIHRPGTLVSSMEPKACDTARAVAASLGLPWSTADGLHEHDRTGVPVMAPDVWRDRLRELFARPDEQVLGRETAHQAARRFGDAIERLLAMYSAGNVAVVSHGTVISLFVAVHNDLDPYQLWQRLSMPSIVALELPGFRLREVVVTVS